MANLPIADYQHHPSTRTYYASDIGHLSTCPVGFFCASSRPSLSSPKQNRVVNLTKELPARAHHGKNLCFNISTSLRFPFFYLFCSILLRGDEDEGKERRGRVLRVKYKVGIRVLAYLR